MRLKIRLAAGGSLVAMLLLPPAADAADLGGGPSWLPAPTIESVPSLMWMGRYMGINGGYSHGASWTKEDSAQPFNGTATEKFRDRSNGFTGGFQVGYNYQFGNIVAGLEADLNLRDLSSTLTSVSGAATATTTSSYIGTVRPRLGIAAGPFLLYGTAGLAYGSPTTTITGNTGNPLSATNSDMRYGWAAGAGVEYRLDRNWSLKAEYLHTDLGSTAISGVAADGNTYSWNQTLIDNSIRLGINYRF